MGLETIVAAKKKKKKKDKVFNDRPRKIFRKIIPNGEVVFGVFFIGFVLLMGIWFALRRDDFDPGERDVAIEVLIAQSVEDHLYEPPLLRWVDPALVRTGGPVMQDLGPFPASIVGNGWETDGRLQEFDSTNLYEKINGQETQYKAYGFQYMHFLSISNPSEGLDVSIELYDMGTFQNALGIFAAQRSEGSQVESRENVFYYLTEVGVLGIVDQYYFKMTGNESHAVLREHALRFITDIPALSTGAGETPVSFMVLSQGMQLDFQDILYVKEDVFQYDFAKDFWFGNAGTDSPVKYFIHESEDPESAKTLFDQILEEHLYEFSLVEREDTDVFLKHEFLKSFATLNHSGKWVYGLEGAPTEELARHTLSAFQEILLDDAASTLDASEEWDEAEF